MNFFGGTTDSHDDDYENDEPVQTWDLAERVITEEDVMAALMKIVRVEGDYLDEKSIIDYLSENTISAENETIFRQYLEEAWPWLINTELKTICLEYKYYQDET